MMRKLLAALAAALLLGHTAQAQSPGALTGATILSPLNPGDYVCGIISASGGVANQCATLAAMSSAGVAGINAQTGTSYTVVASDAGKLITFNNASAVAVTLPQAGTAGFAANKEFIFTNLGAGAVTITPAVSTIGGSATLVLNQNRGTFAVSDGTNYQLESGVAHLSQSPALVSEGGTGLSAGTSGGVPYFSGTTAMASSALLTNHGLIVGGGAGAAPAALSVGATGALLQGSTGANPAFATALTGNYTFSGSPIAINGALTQFGAGAGTPTHIASGQTTAPALTSCGTSPAITGTDTAGIVTMGTGNPTGCVITFNVAYTAAPYCVVAWIATPLASQSYATSNAAITLTQTATSSNKVQYVCIAQSGG